MATGKQWFFWTHQGSCTCELITVLTMAHTRSVQAQDRPNPSIGRGAGSDTPPRQQLLDSPRESSHPNGGPHMEKYVGSKLVLMSLKNKKHPELGGWGDGG